MIVEDEAVVREMGLVIGDVGKGNLVKALGGCLGGMGREGVAELRFAHVEANRDESEVSYMMGVVPRWRANLTCPSLANTIRAYPT